MVLGSEYVTMPSCASAALSPIGLCKVVLRAGSRAETVIFINKKKIFLYFLNIFVKIKL